MRKASVLLFAAVSMLVPGVALAQGIDFAFGLSAVHSSSGINSSTGADQQVGGGIFPSFSGDFLIHKNFGVQGEVAWRASRNLYSASNLEFRPVLWDFNGIYAPRFGPVGIELMAGVGALSARFYNPSGGIVSCSGFTGSCTNYVSSNHFAGHFGAGLRLYPFHGGLFIRPEVHVYAVRNNVEFSSNIVERVGASIGYSFGR